MCLGYEILSGKNNSLIITVGIVIYTAMRAEVEENMFSLVPSDYSLDVFRFAPGWVKFSSI